MDILEGQSLMCLSPCCTWCKWDNSCPLFQTIFSRMFALHTSEYQWFYTAVWEPSIYCSFFFGKWWIPFSESPVSYTWEFWPWLQSDFDEYLASLFGVRSFRLLVFKSHGISRWKFQAWIGDIKKMLRRQVRVKGHIWKSTW